MVCGLANAVKRKHPYGSKSLKAGTSSASTNFEANVEAIVGLKCARIARDVDVRQAG